MLTKYMNDKLDWSIDEIESNNLNGNTLQSRSKSKSLNKYKTKDKITNNSNSSINTLRNNSYLYIKDD